MSEKKKAPEEIQQFRDEKVQELKSARKERDDLRQQADQEAKKPLRNKARELLGMSIPAVELGREADVKSSNVKEKLKSVSRELKQKEKDVTQEKVFNVLADLKSIEDGNAAHVFSKILENNEPYLRHALTNPDLQSQVVSMAAGYFDSYKTTLDEFKSTSETLAKLIVSNIDELSKMINSGNRRALDLTLHSYEHISADEKQKIQEVLTSNVSVLINSLEQGSLTALKGIDIIFDSPENQNIQQEILKLLESKIENLDINSLTNIFIETSAIQGTALQMLSKSIQKKYGIEIDVLKDWGYDDNRKKQTIENIYLQKSINTLVSLEIEKPGVTKFLFEKFGIKNFARYPQEVLIKQCEDYDKDQPYGVIIYPRYENEGLGFINNEEVFRSMYEQMGDKMGIRICEAGTREDIGNILLNMDKKYGEQNKISFAILGAHGNHGGMFFDIRHDGKGYFGIPTLRRKRVIKKARSFFVEKPSIILASCHTGKEQEFAQQLSENLGDDAEVLAPVTRTTIKEITPHFNEQGISFNITFDRPGIERRYRGGELEESETTTMSKAA